MPEPTALRVADLPQNSPTRFDLRPATDVMAALAGELDLSGLKKLSFKGEVRAKNNRDWQLTGHLGATVVQPCVVTLAPVTTRIETDVVRTFLADIPESDDPEVEMADDETIEPLGSHIDPAAVMAEALSLVLPLYPRSKGAELRDANFTQPGIKPMTDEDARPFAGLAGLRDTLDKKE